MLSWRVKEAKKQNGTATRRALRMPPKPRTAAGGRKSVKRKEIPNKQWLFRLPMHLHPIDDGGFLSSSCNCQRDKSAGSGVSTALDDVVVFLGALLLWHS